MTKNILDRQNIIRRMAGSILASNLTAKEINLVSNELIKDRTFSTELGESIRKSMLAFDINPYTETKKYKIDDLQNETNWIDSTMSKIQEKKISKKDIIEALPTNTFSNISKNSLIKMSLRDLLLRAFTNPNQSTINSFIRKLGIENEIDPYLAGIDNKRY